MTFDAMWRLDLALLRCNEHDANAGFNGWTVWHAARRAIADEYGHPAWLHAKLETQQ